MNRAGNNLSFGSVLFGISQMFERLKNQRGEIGDGNPGSDPLEPETDAKPLEPEPSTGQPPDGNITTPEDPPAAALNTDDGIQAKPSEPPEEPTETPADTAFHKSERFQEMNQSLKDTQAQVEQMKAQLDQANEIANFYATQFNELQQLGPDGRVVAGTPQQQGQNQQMSNAPMQPEQTQIPDGVVGPGNWEDQEQQAAWTEHVAAAKAQALMEQAYQQTLMPMLSQLTNAVATLQQNVARSGKDDFDDVISEVNKQIFQLGPDGKVYSVLNPALLNYFKTQPNPYEAMYKHGLAAKAPQLIKKGVQKQTKHALRKIGKQPAGPTQPKGGDGPGELPELDWDTPEAQTEQILHKRGLI